MYLLTVIRYIHHNPIKASITGKPEEYVWSSCAAYYAAVAIQPNYLIPG